uniref:MHC class I-like antigen recognition-like domain-containing protein n=1 Tax=Poecilia reticulata TaxID=8081 RepID=A0A3P9NAB1_POERE
MGHIKHTLVNGFNTASILTHSCSVCFMTVIHSLRYFYSASSGLPDVPSYMSAGLLDDVQISYCDSIANRNIPKQDWMNNVSSDNPHYWEEETLTCLAKQETLKENIEIAKLRFNQTGGLFMFHFLHRMYGCEWDDESQQVTSYNQYGYDGEDFLTLDMESNRWIAPKQQAVLTTNKWNSNTAELEYRKNYLNQECPDWLKKYVDYGRSSLMRTVPCFSLFLSWRNILKKKKIWFDSLQLDIYYHATFFKWLLLKYSPNFLKSQLLEDGYAVLLCAKDHKYDQTIC